MRETVSGYIIYDKFYRAFLLADGDHVDSMFEANIWKHESDVQNIIKTFDDPETCEVWEVEKTIRTII